MRVTEAMAEIAIVAFQLTLTWYTLYVLFCLVLNNSQHRINNPPNNGNMWQLAIKFPEQYERTIEEYQKHNEYKQL